MAFALCVSSPLGLSNPLCLSLPFLTCLPPLTLPLLTDCSPPLPHTPLTLSWPAFTKYVSDIPLPLHRAADPASATQRKRPCTHWTEPMLKHSKLDKGWHVSVIHSSACDPPLLPGPITLPEPSPQVNSSKPRALHVKTLSIFPW